MITPEDLRTLGLSLVGVGGILIAIAGAHRSLFVAVLGSGVLMLGVVWAR